MFKPWNGHIQIEPLEYDAFIASTKTSYAEIGKVVAVPDSTRLPFKAGDKVFFDSWLAAKFPKDNDTFYWLVPIESIRAYEVAE